MGTRAWLVAQYLLMAAWTGAIALAEVAGFDLLWLLVLAGASTFGIWLVVNPRRRWWGPGPRLLIADRAARSRYQQLLTVAMVVMLVGFTVAFTVLRT